MADLYNRSVPTGSSQSAAWAVAVGQQWVREVAGEDPFLVEQDAVQLEGFSLRKRQNDQMNMLLGLFPGLGESCAREGL